MTQPAEWHETTEAAALLGVGVRELLSFADEGLLPAYRIDEVIRFRASELDEFCETHPDRVASADERSRAAHERARLSSVRFEGLTTIEVARLLGITRQAVSDRGKHNSLVRCRSAPPADRNGARFPTWQFVDNRIAPGLRTLIAVAQRAGMQGAELDAWMTFDTSRVEMLHTNQLDELCRLLDSR